MRTYVIHIAMLLLLACMAVPPMSQSGAAHASLIPDEPQQRLYWNRFLALVEAGDYIVGLNVDGLVLLKYDPSFAAYDAAGFEAIDERSQDMRMRDGRLIVRTTDDNLYVFDATRLPEFELMYKLEPPVPYDDFDVNRSSLYLSRWFDGVWKYEMDISGGLTFADSTMRPVLSTQLLIENDTLYVLDRYNGISRFDIGGPEFQPAGELLVPRRALHFDKVGDSFAFAMQEPLLYVGEFGHAGSGIVDSIADIGYIDRVYSTATWLVLQTDRTLEFVRRSDMSHQQTVEASYFYPTGQVVALEGGESLLLPNEGTGGTIFDLTNPGMERVLLFRSGPINHLLFTRDVLLTAGRGNPIDVFTVSDSMTLSRDYSIYQQFSNIRGLATNGDTLYAMFGDVGQLAIIPKFTNPKEIDVEAAISVDTTRLVDVKVSDKTFDGWTPIMVSRFGRIDVYAAKDTILAEHKGSWRLIGEPLDFLLGDSVLVVSYSKKELLLYRVYDDLSYQFRSAFALTDAARHLTMLDDRILVWAYNRIFVLNYENLVEPSMDTVITLPFSVLDAEVHGDLLYTIGPGGMGVFEIVNNRPVLLHHGGMAGNELAVHDDQLVATDGTHLAVYQLPPLPPITNGPDPTRGNELAKNFPNPFNLSTTIQYSVPSAGNVTVAVYNSLGQRVVTLIDEWQAEGVHTVEWDGRSAGGNVVASGVYFLQISTAEASDSHKMMLLK